MSWDWFIEEKILTYLGLDIHRTCGLNGAVWRLMRVGRILICVHTTNKDSLLLLLLLLQVHS